jgi:hypothetical protein
VVENFKSKRYYFNAFPGNKVVYSGREKKLNSCEKEYGIDAYTALMGAHIVSDLASGLYGIGAAGTSIFTNVKLKNNIDFSLGNLTNIGETA